MSAISAITVPKWGLMMTEGTVSEWLVQEGDSLALGDPVMDMETAKIVNTVESIVAGVLRRIVAQPGDTLEIGELLGVVADADATDTEIDAFIVAYVPQGAVQTKVLGGEAEDAVSSPAMPAASATVQRDIPASAAVTSLSEGEDDSHLHSSVYARKLAREVGVNLHNVTATGRNARISKADVIAAIEAAGGPVPATGGGRGAGGEAPRSSGDDSMLKATAVARRLAKTLGINLHDCRVSGSRGRVCKADVEAANALLKPASATTAVMAEGVSGGHAAVPAYEQLPMTGMRKTIASRLQQSKQQAPHFRLVVDCCLGQLLALRKQINDSHPGVKLSVNDFMIKATAMALVKCPDVNLQFDGETIRRYRHADLSIAVALEKGLITPIVKRADTLSLTEISTEVRNLATRAKTGMLRQEEFMGGNFSISNLGMHGIKHFDAILNPPQVGILAVGSGEKRVVVEGNETRVATMMTLTASFDHRVIDGAVGAGFMVELKRFIESPALMLA